MKITNLGVGHTPPPSRSRIDEPEPAPGEGQSTVAGTPGYAPSAELLELISLVRQQPAVREDRVNAVAAKLRQGHYLTPDSARATAEAMAVSMA